MKYYGDGTCQVCGKVFRLTKDGRVRYHGPHPRPCDGGGLLPKEAGR